jgi:hypothetical protein
MTMTGDSDKLIAGLIRGILLARFHDCFDDFRVPCKAQAVDEAHGYYANGLGQKRGVVLVVNGLENGAVDEVGAYYYSEDSEGEHKDNVIQPI